MKKAVFSILFLVIIIGVACDAPRNNPLDPYNPNNRPGKADSSVYIIQGKITSFYQEITAISKVLVSFENGKFSTFSDKDGKYRLVGTDLSAGYVKFSLENYVVDSVYVDFVGSATENVDFVLDRLPVVQVFDLFSVSEAKANITDDIDYYFNIRVKVDDPESDEEDTELFLAIPELGHIEEPFELAKNSNEYTGSFSLFELSILSPDEVIGKDFELQLKHNDSTYITIAEKRVMRILRDFPGIRAPKENQTVTDTPIVFQWTRPIPDANYDYNFEVEIFLKTNSKLIHEKTISNVNTVSIEESGLDPDRYQVKIWVVDEFKNRASSIAREFLLDYEEILQKPKSIHGKFSKY